MYIIIKMEQPKKTDEFMKSLSAKELKAYNIAKSHLGSSFSLDKCVFYLKWLTAQQSLPPPSYQRHQREGRRSRVGRAARGAGVRQLPAVQRAQRADRR